MTLSGRRHNTDDIIATVLAVEPMKFIYRGRIAVFSTAVLREERVVIVAEQRPDCSEEESFQWMSRVLQVREECIRICSCEHARPHACAHTIAVCHLVMTGVEFRSVRLRTYKMKDEKRLQLKTSKIDKGFLKKCDALGYDH